ncbi:eukaryotic translation initiation factor 3 subunit H isoform X2 [Physcomitrium patens]|uniref:Eukaryotic translation initiation factor 3 subunit H n=1 Tax=Physcomitrium patens TaxID=3218 RepID=A0A7I4DYY0_PHYPA|nr:eukaryotic translation initiation factor 3 subunit H-like isoform X2 [Physcomitrium patens]|eukprot:XP_024378110.1 eukaryotic translation initiation factor 3 subunit H-like isoform X2 [Physcomitrella patens]
MADGNPPPLRSFAQAAQAEVEVQPLRVVQIEGLVALKIIKHCKECMPALVTGQLLGLDIGSILEVTNCFPFPSRGGEDEDELDTDGANYQLEMMRCLREVNVDNNTVGWYQSTYMGSFQTVELIETFLNYQENIKRCVCIIYDPVRSGQGVLALKALKLSEDFMELYRSQSLSGEKLREKNMAWTHIFEEIPVKISNSALVSSLMTELEPEAPATQFQYYYRNLSRQQAQQQAWLQKRRTENAARRASGEEPLPEEEPNNPVFKILPEPSRLDSYLITNQISNYCSQVNGFAGQSLSKLYLMDAFHED